MVDNRLTVLTETAKELDQLDRAAAEKALAEALAMKGVSDSEYKTKQRAVESARAQLRLTG